MNKKKIILLGADILLLAVLIFLDQLTKHFAVVYLKDQMPISIIDGVFELNYLENRGAAFGMLQDQKLFFIFIAVVILAVIVYVLIKTPNQRKYTKLHIALVCIAGGAIGNMIDRLKLDYVVDFLNFSLINFPIFGRYICHIVGNLSCDITSLCIQRKRSGISVFQNQEIPRCKVDRNLYE